MDPNEACVLNVNKLTSSDKPAVLSANSMVSRRQLVKFAILLGPSTFQLKASQCGELLSIERNC